MKKKNISVIGLGVVGLTTAVGFALKGHKIIGVDIDDDKVAKLSRKMCPVFESGLCDKVKAADLEVTTNFEPVLNTDISFICGGTPRKSNGSIDLSYVQGSAGQLADVLRKKKREHLVVVRSTVVPGTTETVIAPVFKNISDIGVCVNPEFFREGQALEDFMEPNRIVIGENESNWGDMLASLYEDFSCNVLRTTMSTAEMIKYASNSFLATKISFINEIGNMCKRLGIDVYDVAKGMGYDNRIGDKFLKAGIGFGGYCLPKDVAALAARGEELGYKAGMLKQVLEINDSQPLQMLELLKKHIPILSGKTIGVLGLSFKPATDDIRESRAALMVEALLKEGAKVRAYDPQAMYNFKQLYPDIEYSSPQRVLESDAVLIITEWDEFSNLDYKNSIVVDGRRIDKAREALIYEGLCW
jgi:UDPglucose 6-dehydrogenase